jgi:hypothetical protein
MATPFTAYFEKNLSPGSADNSPDRMSHNLDSFDGAPAYLPYDDPKDR